MVLLPGCKCCGGGGEEWGCAMTQECVDALVGACCLPDGSCQQLNKWQCDTAGGTFIGPGLPCSPGICDPCTDCNTACTDCPKAWPQGYAVTFKVLEDMGLGNTTDAAAIAAAKGRVESVGFDCNILTSNGFATSKRMPGCPNENPHFPPDCATKVCMGYNNGEWFIASSGAVSWTNGGQVYQYCDPEPGVVIPNGDIVEYMTEAEWDAACAAWTPDSVRRWAMSYVTDETKQIYPSPCSVPAQPVVVEGNVVDTIYNTPNAEGTALYTTVWFRTAITLTPIPYTP